MTTATNCGQVYNMGLDGKYNKINLINTYTQSYKKEINNNLTEYTYTPIIKDVFNHIFDLEAGSIITLKLSPVY